jgi:hypothetical protein
MLSNGDMSTWFAIPSKRSPEEAELCLSEWRKMGYKIALWRDLGDPEIPCDLLLVGEYQGYHNSVNALCKEILKLDPAAMFIVSGGDDMKPDPNKQARDITLECGRHFGEAQGKFSDGMPWSTFGVMQPTGDLKLWPQSRVDIICGSPWMGREFCRRMYGGKGPFWHSYYHMWGDEEMHKVCKMLGVLWNRPDVTHFHAHWQRPDTRKPYPEFLHKANEAYAVHEPEFRYREANNWPGHDPLPA